MFDRARFEYAGFDNSLDTHAQGYKVITTLITEIRMIKSIVKVIETNISTKQETESRDKLIEMIYTLQGGKLDKEIIEILIESSLDYINKNTHNCYNYETFPGGLIPTISRIIELNLSQLSVQSEKLGDYSITYRNIAEVDKSINTALKMYRKKIFKMGV